MGLLSLAESIGQNKLSGLVVYQEDLATKSKVQKLGTALNVRVSFGFSLKPTGDFPQKKLSYLDL